MDADTTTPIPKAGGLSTEEVTTTSNENNLTVLPCSDSEIAGVADEKVASVGAKQLEIVIMEECNSDSVLVRDSNKSDEEQDKEAANKLSDESQYSGRNDVCCGKERVVETWNSEGIILSIKNEEGIETHQGVSQEDNLGDVEADSSMSQEPKPLEEAPDSSVEVDTSEKDDKDVETKAPRRRGRSSKKGSPDASFQNKGRVEKVLQMKYRRSIKHYLVHWADTDPSEDSWLILNPSVEGFVEQVKVYDEERKKANDRGEGASSKQTSRTKHSWYYLSSSEDEDSILKDNFWKNLDEGKLNLYQTSSDMYSALKEVGRASKSYNQEVHAIIPEDYLAETKRVTRSRVLTPARNRTRAKDTQKNVESDYSIDTVSTDKKDKKEVNVKAKRVQKNATPQPQKKDSKSTKRESTKKVGNAAKKLKTSSNEVVSGVSAASEEEDEDDDMESEDDVSEMLVPITPGNQSSISDVKTMVENEAAKIESKKVTPKASKKLKPEPKDDGGGDDDNDDDDLSSTSSDNEAENAEGKGDKMAVFKEEKLKHLEESISSVIEESRRWYEEHFGDNLNKEDISDKNSTEEKIARKPSADGEDDNVDNDKGVNIDIGKIRKKRLLKRKKGWTSFLEENPKKRKAKLEKFEGDSKCVDDGMTAVASNDNIIGESSQSDNQSIKKEDEKCNESEQESKVINTGDLEKLEKIEDIPKKMESDKGTDAVHDKAKENTEELTESKVDVEDISSKDKSIEEKKLHESVQPLLMDQQSKMELAKKVSQYIMKGTMDKKEKKTSSDEASKLASLENVSKSGSDKEDSSRAHEKSQSKKEELNRKSTDDQKSSKDLKKIGQIFNLKLMRNEDILSKREKMARTHIDSSRPTNVQFLMAIKSNDIVKVKTMLENGGQINLEFIDMKTGLSLVWLAVKNNLMSILILLATHGADIEKRNRDGFTPLIYAAEKGFFQVVHTLCQLGINLYATAPDGETAIVKAIKNRHKNVVQILLGAGISLGESTMVEKNLIQLAKHVGSNDIVDVINFHKSRLNKELLLGASQCFESSVKIDQQVFPIQSFRLIDSRHFKIFFRYELQPAKKTRGMLLFVGHGHVAHNEVSCSLRGRSQVTRAILNEQPLQSISDDMNFIFTFSPLVDGSNRLDIYTHPLSRDNYQTNLIVCAYTIELNLGITPQ